MEPYSRSMQGIDANSIGDALSAAAIAEMLDKLYPGCTTHFDEIGTFHSSHGSLEEVVDHLLAQEVRPVGWYGSRCRICGHDCVDGLKECGCERQWPKVQKSAARNAGLTIGDMVIDWWLRPPHYAVTDDGVTISHPLKTWSGQMAPARNFISALDAVRRLRIANGRVGILDLVPEKPRGACKVGLSHDGRAAVTTLAAGTSLEAIGASTLVSPLVSALAIIGAQTHEPARDGEWVTYSTWAKPLPALVTRAVFSNAIPHLTRCTYKVKPIPDGGYGLYRFPRSEIA